MEVILANSEDILNECLKIRNEVFVVEKGVPASIENDENDVLHGSYKHFLAKKDGKSVAALRIHLENDILKIQRFCVLKEYRGCNVGREILDYLDEYSRANCVREIVLDSKYDVFGFYENGGYEVISEPFYEAGVKHVKMKKVVGKL